MHGFPARSGMRITLAGWRSGCAPGSHHSPLWKPPRASSGGPMATAPNQAADDREVPAYDIHEFRPRRSRYAVLIPVLNEGDRLLQQLHRMEFLAGNGDIIIDRKSTR